MVHHRWRVLRELAYDESACVTLAFTLRSGNFDKVHCGLRELPFQDLRLAGKGRQQREYCSGTNPSKGNFLAYALPRYASTIDLPFTDTQLLETNALYTHFFFHPIFIHSIIHTFTTSSYHIPTFKKTSNHSSNISKFHYSLSISNTPSHSQNGTNFVRKLTKTPPTEPHKDNDIYKSVVSPLRECASSFVKEFSM